MKEPIAVVGMSVLFPESIDSAAFWKNIIEAKDLISDVPISHWLVEDYYDPDPKAADKTYGKRGGFLPYVDFDALDWGVPPSIIEATDVTQLLALMVAKSALQDMAGGDFSDLDRSKMSVILGVTSAQKLLGHMTSRLQKPIWIKAMREFGLPETEVENIAKRIEDHYVPWQESTFPGLLGNVVAGRIANRLDLGGTNCVTDAACASAFSAISMAVNELLLGDSDSVLVGGADAINDIFMHMCFSKTPALSMSGDIRPFSDKADGTLLGEGVSIFALKRLEDAERDGNTIYALLRGVGSSSDGRSKSVYAPVAEGQANAYRRAYQKADIDPKTIQLIEAHGTGTKAGDAAEFSGLNQVFSDSDAKNQSIALGTVKAQIGHTKATAGAAGLFKAIMAVQSGIYPPSIKIDAPNPSLNIKETPFYLNTESRPWFSNGSHPRRAGVSSFGFGGSNFHIAVEEYQGKMKKPRLRALGHELFLFSGSSESSLRAKLQDISTQIKDRGFNRLAWTAQKAFKASDPFRLSIVAGMSDDLIQKVAAALNKGFSSKYSLPAGVHFSNQAKAEGKVAFLFPGQGSQYVGMGSELAQHFPLAKEAWEEAKKVDFGTEWLHDVVYPIPVFSDQERKEQQLHLTKTQWAQPAIGVTSLSMLNLVREMGIEADYCAGHSYGELTALYYGGYYSTQAFIRISQKRGQLMNEAAKISGSMSAVKASAKKLQPMIKASGFDVVIANHNSPKQSVISGRTAEIEKMEAYLSEMGVFAQRLGVATAFHSSVVSGSVRPFSEFLSGIPMQQPSSTVYSNSTAGFYPSEEAEVKKILANQIANPVRFVETIEDMYAKGVRTFIEIGPKTILSKLVGSILRRKEFTTVGLDRSGKSSVFGFLNGIAELATLGHAFDTSVLWTDYAEPTDLSTRKKAKLPISINGANYNKPYPPKNGAEGYPTPNPPRQPEIKIVKEIQYIEKEVEKVVIQKQTVQSTAQSNPSPRSVKRKSTMSQENHSTPISNQWLVAFQTAQQQTAAAHTAYQQAMSSAHLAYLQAAQTGLAGLAALAGASVETPAIIQPQQVVVPQPVIQPQPQMPVQPISPVQTVQRAAAKPVYQEPPVSTPVTTQAARPAKPVVAAEVIKEVSTSSAALTITELLLSVVAEKTGYPADSLDLSMSLEGDLGIDSIKRVEILSTMQDKAPSLPEVDGAQMAQLQTLGQIVEYLGANDSASTAVQTQAEEAQTVNVLEDINIEKLLLSVVAEKTGYPADSLDLSMSLEGDLGIDSIKRVEILSTMQDKAPSLPEVDGAQMAQLQTLGQIISYMKGDDSADFSQAEVSKQDASAETEASVFELDSKIPAPAEAIQAEASQVEEEQVLELIPEAEIESEDVAKETLEELVEETSTGTSRWVVRPEPATSNGLSHASLWDAKIAIIGPDSVAVQLALYLQKMGIAAHVSNKIGSSFTGVIDLRALEQKSVAKMMRQSQDCFLTAQKLAPQAKVFIVVADWGGDFGFGALERQKALSTGIAGVLRTANQEWDDCYCKMIDIATQECSDKQVAKKLAEEIIFGGLAIDVGIPKNGVRQVLKMKEEPVQGAKLHLDHKDVIVVSGGARGVTARCVINLARQSQAKFILLGRTILEDDPCPLLNEEREIIPVLIKKVKADGKIMPPKALKRWAQRILAIREIRANLKEMRSYGATVTYFPVDVTDGAIVEEKLQHIQKKWGAITGLIHGAGVLADKLIAEKSIDDFNWVFDVKIRGMGALLSCIDLKKLKLLCFFSSVAARTGNRGQSDYAAANEVLNRMAHSLKQSHPHISVHSIGWGPWEGGMVTPELKKYFTDKGVHLIPLEEGAELFLKELNEETNVEVIIGGKEGLVSSKNNARYLLSLQGGEIQPLEGHDYEGVLVPMTWVVNIFQEVASAFRAGLKLCLRDLRVFRPVRIESLQKGLKVEIECQENEDGILIQLLENGQTSYQANVHEDEEEEPSIPVLEKGEEITSIYGTCLFHSGEFQVLKSVELSNEGAVGEIAFSTWQAEMLAKDAALQLALLWTERRLSAKSLPVAIKSIRQFSKNRIVKGILVGKSSNSMKAVSDAYLLDENGDVVVEMAGIETFALSSNN